MADSQDSLSTAQKLAIAAVASIVLSFCVTAYFWDGSGKIRPDTPIEPIVCQRNLKCWAEQNIHLTDICIRSIEAKTEYDFRWTDKMLEPKFTHNQWHNKSGFTLTYSGDKLLVQNSYGAFARTSYECDLDPIGKKVLAVRIYPGRIPPSAKQ